QVWVPSFTSTTLITVSNKGQIYTAWSDHFLVKRYDAKGTYVHAFYYPYKNAPMDMDRFNKGNKPVTAVFGASVFPDTYPALRLMLIDEKNRLWVATITKGEQVYQWWVLDKKGKPLARFTWPRNRLIREITNGFAYTLEIEKE